MPTLEFIAADEFARVVADARREPHAQRLLRREDASRKCQVAQHVVAHQRFQDRRAGHVGHEAPLDLHDRHACIGRNEAHVRAKRDTVALALDGGEHLAVLGQHQVDDSWGRQLVDSECG